MLKRDEWSGCIVAATGPSLTPAVAEACRGFRVVAVNDAYRMFPWADVLYGCDAKWWNVHRGVPEFKGEKWSSQGPGNFNDKRAQVAKYGLRIVNGRHQDGFSFEPGMIHYGRNSGFQAINLALQFGAVRVVLVGFDMRVNGKRHFFGDHPKPLSNSIDYRTFIPKFEKGAKSLPADIEILNCTPQSALRCFPMVSLEEGLDALREVQAGSKGTASADQEAARGLGGEA